MSTKDKNDKQEDLMENQVWKNSNLIKAVSGILTEIIQENKNEKKPTKGI